MYRSIEAASSPAMWHSHLISFLVLYQSPPILYAQNCEPGSTDCKSLPYVILTFSTRNALRQTRTSTLILIKAPQTANRTRQAPRRSRRATLQTDRTDQSKMPSISILNRFQIIIPSLLIKIDSQPGFSSTEIKFLINAALTSLCFSS